MAAPKKKSSSKKTTAKKAVPKKTVKKSTTKKTVSKKAAPKRKTTAAKKQTAKKATTTTKKVQRSVDTAPKKALKPKKKSWFSVLTFGVIVLGLAVAGYLSSNPELLQRIQANILAQLDGENTDEQVIEASQVMTDELDQGILITWKQDGENELKLKDIFRTVFPETKIAEVSYDSEQGKELISQLGVKEVPAIFYEQRAFQRETLSEVVKDLFTLNNGYYGLNVSLVNPSHQLHIGGALHTEGSINMGETTAPLDVFIYSDPKCQHCRVNAQNNLDDFAALMEEGIAELHFLDLPQSASSYYHSIALACVGNQKPDSYLDFRQDLFGRANLSESYTQRQLQDLGIDYDKDCNENTVRAELRARLRSADEDGVTGVPAVYIGKNDETQYIRVTGAKDFTEYEKIFDEMLGNTESNQQDGNTTETQADATGANG